MGCFNMRCAATGVPIVEGTDVVMFDLCENTVHSYGRKSHAVDMFGDQMSIMSMPRFGVYNDYGDIESEQHNPEWDNINLRLREYATRIGFIPKFKEERYSTVESQLESYDKDHRMFILRAAYDHMLQYKSPHTWMRDSEERRQEAKHAVIEIMDLESEENKLRIDDTIKKYFSGVDDAVEALDKANLVVRSSMTNRAKKHLHQAYSLSREDEYIWEDIVLSDPDLGDLYYNTIRKVRNSAWRDEWSVYPSKYSGQEVNESQLMMRNIGTSYLTDYFKDMENW